MKPIITETAYFNHIQLPAVKNTYTMKPVKLKPFITSESIPIQQLFDLQRSKMH